MAQLKEFGVSPHGARAYLALLHIGVAEARTVSEHAGIPSAKVYAALLQLQKRGLAEIGPGKPRKYAAIAMGAFVERRLEEQKAHTADLEGRAQTIASMFPSGPGATRLERPQTVTIQGKRNVMQQFRDASEATRSSIFLVAEGALRGEPPVRRLLEAAEARGVEVCVHDHVRSAVADDARRPPKTLVATFDGRAALIAQWAPAHTGDRGPSSAIFTTDAGFTAPLHGLLTFRARSARADQGLRSRPATPAEIDARTFHRMLREHAATPPREVRAAVHDARESQPGSDGLWAVVRAADRARVLVPPSTHSLPRVPVDLPPTVELRSLPHASRIAFAILDGQRSFFVTRSVASTADSPDDLHGISADPSIVSAFDAHFELTWKAAAPLAARRGHGLPSRG